MLVDEPWSEREPGRTDRQTLRLAGGKQPRGVVHGSWGARAGGLSVSSQRVAATRRTPPRRRVGQAGTTGRLSTGKHYY